MTVSRRELSATSKTTVVDARWDQINPLYCANQAYTFANVATTGNVAMWWGSSDTVVDYPSFLPPICLTANGSSNVQYFVGSGLVFKATANTLYFPVLKADFTTNTVAVVNSSYHTLNANTNMKLNQYSSTLMEDNVLLIRGMYSDYQVLTFNTATNALTYGTRLSNNITANTIGQLKPFGSSKINTSAVMVRYTTANSANNSQYLTLGLRIVDVNKATATVSLGSMIEISSSTLGGGHNQVMMLNQNQGFAVINATHYYNFSVSGTTITAGAVGALSNGTFHDTSIYGLAPPEMRYVLLSKSGTKYDLVASTNRYNFGPAVTTSTPLFSYTFNTSGNTLTYNGQSAYNGFVDTTNPRVITNNKKPAVIAINGDDGPAANINFTRLVPVDASNVSSISKFSITEISGYSVTSPQPWPAGPYKQYGVFPLVGTTRGLAITIGAQVNTLATGTNTVYTVYRFLDANASSQTAIYTVTGANSYTAPRAGQLFIQCFGAGGTGNVASTSNNSAATRPGGGGGYAHKTINVTAGQVVALNIGSPTTKTNTTANTIVCTPGGNGTTTAVGAGGTASGGDVNANGSSGIAGTIGNISSKGTEYRDKGNGGRCGSPGPTVTGTGWTAASQAWGNGYKITGLFAWQQSSGLGCGGIYNTNSASGTGGSGMAGGNGAIIIGIK